MPLIGSTPTVTQPYFLPNLAILPDENLISQEYILDHVIFTILIKHTNHHNITLTLFFYGSDCMSNFLITIAQISQNARHYSASSLRNACFWCVKLLGSVLSGLGFTSQADPSAIGRHKPVDRIQYGRQAAQRPGYRTNQGGMTGFVEINIRHRRTGCAQLH